jgi:hypothetical protein
VGGEAPLVDLFSAPLSATAPLLGKTSGTARHIPSFSACLAKPPRQGANTGRQGDQPCESSSSTSDRRLRNTAKDRQEGRRHKPRNDNAVKGSAESSASTSQGSNLS